MFKDLDWGAALKRAALMTSFYWVIVYGFSVAFGENFSIGGQDPLQLILTTVTIFVLFTVFTAFTERARRRRVESQKAQNSTKKTRPPKATDDDDGEEPASSLKGRPNPNASRRKTRRKR